jgi:fatty acid desaturase
MVISPTSPTSGADPMEPAREPPIDRAKEREAAVRRKVAAIKGFYVHFAVFLVVICGLFVLDWLTGAGWWFQWVLLGWGAGVLAHAVGVFSDASRRVAAWEERKVREMMREE